MPNPIRPRPQLPAAQTVVVLGDASGRGSAGNAIRLDVPGATIYPVVSAAFSMVGAATVALRSAVDEGAFSAVGSATLTFEGVGGFGQLSISGSGAASFVGAAIADSVAYAAGSGSASMIAP